MLTTHHTKVLKAPTYFVAEVLSYRSVKYKEVNVIDGVNNAQNE